MKPNTHSHLLTLSTLALLPLSSTATDYYWDGSQSDHWGRAKNWNSGGAGGHPNANNAGAYLVYNGYPGVGGQGVGSGKMSVGVDDNDTTTLEYSVDTLLVATNASDHDWVFSDGSSASEINVDSDLVFDLRGSGSATFNVEIDIGSNTVDLHGQGSRAILAGKLKGSGTLDATKTRTRSGASGSDYTMSGGGLKLTASNNDGFTGTIKTGLQKVEITQTNGLRNAIIEISNVQNSFIWPNNALIGALTGNYDLALSNNLKVGNKNTNFTYGGKFSGSSHLYKEGTGIWTLSGASTHTGTTYINSGTIKLGNANALQDSIVWLNTSDGLDVNGQDATFAGLGGTGSINLGSNAITIDGNSDVAHLGNVYGTGSITYQGSGTHTLGSSATYSGRINVVNGTFETFGGTALSSGDLYLSDVTLLCSATATSGRSLSFTNTNTEANIEVASTHTLTWSGLINGGSNNITLKKTGAGTLSLTNDSNAFDGTLDIDAGGVTASSTALEHAIVDLAIDNGLSFSTTTPQLGLLIGSGNISLSNDKVLTVGGNDENGTYSGTISANGAAAIHKTGDGTWIFSGTYNGSQTTNLNEGNLVLDGTTNTASIYAIDGAANTSLEGNGRASSRLYLLGDISPDEPGVDNTGTIQAGSMFIFDTFHCDIDSSESDRLITAGVFDTSNATIDLSFHNGAPTQNAYVLVEYGSLSSNTPFNSVLNLPSGYKIDYAYDDGNDSKNIALVADSTAPSLTSITLNTNVSSPTNSNGLSFNVTFSEDVSGVTANDFNITFAGSTGTALLSGSGNSYSLSVPTITGDGLLTVSLKTSGTGIQDEAQNALSTPSASASITIDNTAPSLTNISAVQTGPTNADTIQFNITFNGDVVGVDTNDFTLSYAGSTGTRALSGSGSSYQLSFPNVTGNGAMSLSLKTSGTNIKDAAGNGVNTPGASDSITIDNTAPVITLTGNATEALTVGDSWTDPGASGSDNIDASVSITTGGDTVDTNSAATYTITYNASDTAGNAATQVTRTVTVQTHFTTWANIHSLSEADALMSADPDGDGRSNLEEFAFDSDPTSTDDGNKSSTQFISGEGSNTFAMTFPVRNGASFIGDPLVSATVDGITYTILGSYDLSNFNAPVGIDNSHTPIGLDALSDGWSYKTFYLMNPDSSDELAPQGFLRITVTDELEP